MALGVMNVEDGESLVDRTNHVQRMLNRLTASLRQKLAGVHRGNDAP